MSKKEHDWVLIGLALLFGIDIILLLVGYFSSLPPFDITYKSTSPSGTTTTITLSGISEIIVAVALAIGIIWKMTRK